MSSPNQDKKSGLHNLIVISWNGPDCEQEIVRWCRDCGAVVVDLDADGRTNPGAILKMRFPSGEKCV